MILPSDVRLLAWLGAHLRELERAEPTMPLEDRAAETWEPLIAVADLAGGDWPERARRAAKLLTDLLTRHRRPVEDGA